MSGFSSIGNPGNIPTVGSGANAASPASLFRSIDEKLRYQDLVGGVRKPAPVKVKKVCVKIFDLSDQSQVEEYENLWAELLAKSSSMEVVVDTRKDLVHRADGTSYWMKYVEYVEFGPDETQNSEGEPGKEDNR